MTAVVLLLPGSFSWVLSADENIVIKLSSFLHSPLSSPKDHPNAEVLKRGQSCCLEDTQQCVDTFLLVATEGGLEWVLPTSTT